MGPLYQTAVGVILGTLPLIGVTGWAAFQQNNRFSDTILRFGEHFNSIDGRLGRIEKQLDDLGRDLKALGVRVNTHETKIAVIETHLNLPKIVPAR